MEKSGSSNVSFLHIMTFIFVILKLTGVVSWSWWLVLLPSLIHIGLFFVGLLIVALIALAIYAYEDSNK